jgi:ferredoxin
VRVRLDRTMCDGFGVCAKHAPEYFSLDDWGYASLVGNGTVPEADQPAVRRALLDCPVHAIIEMAANDERSREEHVTNEPLQPPAGDATPRVEESDPDHADVVREAQMMPGM